ncbi:MAG: MarR family transcriptional regulator [Corynebacteriales bacterium]|nr:MarR family transcriptional regulator [Mycobacteriales bacterium]
MDADNHVEDLVNLVFEVTGRLRNGFNATASELGLPPAQALALTRLDAPAPMRDLAEWLSCDASNVTGIVDGLEQRGLVTREPSPTDRRVKFLVLTKAGERKRAELNTLTTTKATQLFKLPAGEQKQLRELLTKVLAE